MFYLHQSNQFESLVDAFVQVHQTGLQDPFATEQVVVQNYRLARWLSLRISEQLGIAANLRFLFPAEYMWDLIRTVVGKLPEVEPYRPGVLRWRILQLLETSPQAYSEIDTYLTNADQLRRYELACRLEELFDRYLFYRPNWINDWETGSASFWQARMWKALAEQTSAMHWVGLQRHFLSNLADSNQPLPPRVLFFGMAQLSPGYLQLLRESARYMDVHIFILNPCQQYWGDIVSEAQKLKQAELVADYLEVGNPLLATLGRQGRDCIDLLIALEPDHEFTAFDEMTGDTLLHATQNDILQLQDPRDLADNLLRFSAEQASESINLHSCYTAMREVEVLHDQILAMLDADENLQCEEIIVMMPSVQDYAALIEAVFLTAPVQLPYAIADRSVVETETSAQILATLLELVDSRYEINSVLAILDYQAVHEHFNLTENDIELIRHWCADTNIRWGVDAKMRVALDLPASAEHSWLAGIKRLLTGAILNSEDLFAETLPYTNIEGSQTVILGRFVVFAELLFNLQNWSSQQHSLADWLQQIRQLLHALLGEQQLSSRALLDQLQQLEEQQHSAEYNAALDFVFCKKLLLNLLQQSSQQQQFASHGISFCELTPMRSVPFKVVCLIGMNDGKFPASDNCHSFDLIEQDGYRRGDRSLRIEQRYLFLESLLAARQRLYISYVGRDVRQNTERPPSVLVSELLDYIESGYAIKPEQITTQHPLQAFSPRYRQAESDLFTYVDYPLSPSLRKTIPAFLTHTDNIAEPAPLTELSLTELLRFIRSPATHFLQQRLGVGLYLEETELPEREPFELEAFKDGELRQIISEHLDNPDIALQRLRALGLLPHGRRGENLVQYTLAEVTELLEQYPDCEQLPAQTIQLKVGETILHGSLNQLTNLGIVDLQFAKLWTNHQLQYWLQHLVLNCINTKQLPAQSMIIHPQGITRFHPVAEPLTHLQHFIDAYQQGQQQVLHFMPKSAYEYAKKMTGKDADKLDEAALSAKALQAASIIWLGNQHAAGEYQKIAYQIAFRGKDPLDTEFQQWAEKLCVPLFHHYDNA